jgi:phosphate/sulfate permease
MDLNTYSTDFLQILGSGGDHEIVCRGIIRPSSTDLDLIPGVLLMRYASDLSLCTVWDGATNTIVCGVLLSPCTAGATAIPATILASGTVKNENCSIYSDGDGDPVPTLVQWNQAQVQSGIIPQGTEYGS